MLWNWQQKDWPNFNYNEAKIALLENRFLQESGVVRGAFTHIREEDKKQLVIELMSTEAVKTSAIEGEYLSGIVFNPLFVVILVWQPIQGKFLLPKKA